MAGLNSLVSDTTSSTTTLPSWYDTAQQNIVSQATAGAAAMPQLQNTVAGGAIQNLSGANNPFFAAQNMLGQIGSGASNPWIVTPTQQQPNWSAIRSDPTFLASVDSFGPASGTGYGSELTSAEHGAIDMGNGSTLSTNLGGGASPFAAGISNAGSMQSGGYTVTPNVNTPLGGLFAAQNKQLEQTLPTTIAPAQAGAIGSGNFGSLRGQTAVDTAKANALSDLQAKQMAAALQSQQTGVNAAQALSNVGSQGTSTMTTLGQAQQAAPLTAVSDLAQVLSAVKAPATVTQSAQLSPLSQLGSLASAATGGISGLNSLVGQLFPYQTDSSGKIITDAKGNPIASTIGSVFGKSILNALGLGGSGNTTNQTQNGATDGPSSGMSVDAQGNLNPGTYPLSTGGTITVDENGNKTIVVPGQDTVAFNSSGVPLDPNTLEPLDTGSSNTGYDSSTGYATDENTAGITADTPLNTDNLGVITGDEG